MEASLDRRDEIGMGDRLAVAVPLQRKFFSIHRRRDIDGDDELKVDWDAGSFLARRR